MTDEMKHYCDLRISELLTMINKFFAGCGSNPTSIEIGWKTYADLAAHGKLAIPHLWGLQINNITVIALAPIDGEELVILRSPGVSFARYFSAHSYPSDKPVKAAVFYGCECGAEKLGHPGHSYWCNKS